MKIQKSPLYILGILLFVASCSYYRPSGPASAGATGGEMHDQYRPTLTESLFENEQATISEENIQKLLDGKIVIHDSLRIAVYKYGSLGVTRYYGSWWNDEEYIKLQQGYFESLSSEIKASDKVMKVFPMPQMMLSQKVTINTLRESAVRLQADMLLIFNVSSNIYYKYKTFKEDEAKAYATCEIVLMDIRTGVVPHCSVITRDNFVTKQDTDLNVEETRKRAETGAILQTLIEGGHGVAEFLNAK